jgi:hypothetical protein
VARVNYPCHEGTKLDSRQKEMLAEPTFLAYKLATTPFGIHRHYQLSQKTDASEHFREQENVSK